ncbi:heavy metal translocating P-type ATPase [Odoribacter sp. OttesenSCG-928-L07]|nr:heavy metal translocating P-type ATPase [Odoribacter sp. OttesenSCG-928-L07]MDL2240355.1 heavy metal translocating P-type ATPase [Bacteroidales bacterium OttesenSCG-928-K22]
MAKNKIIKKTFPVLNMGCAACAAKIDKMLNTLDGIEQAAVNFASSSVIVEFNPDVTSPEKIRQAVQNIGYDIIIEDDKNTSDELDLIHQKKFKQLKNRTVGAIILSVPIFIIGMFFMNMPYANIIMCVLSTPVVFWLGRDFHISAWKQLKYGSVSMDTLVALSTGIAYFFSLFNMIFPQFWISRGITPHVYFEASSVIIAFILLGRLLEEKAKGNTSSAIKKLMGLQPKSVIIIDENGKQKEVSIDKIKKGDVIIVKPGEKIAVDGIVVDGNSYVDESMLSGEPTAVLKEKDSKVFAGTINQKGSFNFMAEKVGDETMLAQIIQMVKDAQGSKAPVQKLVDKIASVFVPVIIGIAVLSFVLWIIFDSANGVTHGLLAMVTVLIIACPCALGLATPTAITVGIGKGAENGILIKDAESLEVAKKVDAIVLDKTGTITEGKPVVTNIIWLNDNDNKKDIFYNLEKLSEHPLADAITQYFIDSKIVEINNFESVTGRGIKAFVDNEQYFAGNRKFLAENNIKVNQQLSEQAEKWTTNTVIWFADAEQALAVIGITDKIKENSKEAINELNNSGIEVYMLTGDNESTAREIAATVGIKHYKSEVLPNEKSIFVKQLQSEGKIVAMVGDGINDSAALAQADLSIAMGKGSDIAMDVAKMTIISSDLNKIPQAIRLSKLTVKTIKQNLFWAFFYNLIAVPIAAGVLYPINGFLLNPMIAGAAMAFSSVSVVTNSLLLKRKKLNVPLP